MPTISLRLTDEQHAQLTAWAHDGERSVQKELIWRLFTQEHFASAVQQAERRMTDYIRTATGDGSLTATFSTKPVVTEADAQPRDIPTRTLAPAENDHFKPDFKKRAK